MRRLIFLTILVFSLNSVYGDKFRNIGELSDFVNNKTKNISTLTEADCLKIIEHINGDVFSLKNFGHHHSRTKSDTNLIMKALAVLSVNTNNLESNSDKIFDALYKKVPESDKNSEPVAGKISTQALMDHRAIMGFLVEHVTLSKLEGFSLENKVSPRLVTYLDLSEKKGADFQKKILNKYSRTFYNHVNAIIAEKKNQKDNSVKLLNISSAFNLCGVKQNASNAAELLTKEVEEGNINAIGALQLISKDEDIESYLVKSGIEKEKLKEMFNLLFLSETINFVKAAATKGNVVAMVSYAAILIEESKTKPDLLGEALNWLKKAADKKNGHALFVLGEIAEKLETPPFSLTADEWYQQAANEGHPEALYKVGNKYYLSRSLEIFKAKDSYFRAAEKGNCAAMYQLGVIYELGYGVMKDEVEAAKWYQRAAAWGNKAAKDKLVSIP